MDSEYVDFMADVTIIVDGPVPDPHSTAVSLLGEAQQEFWEHELGPLEFQTEKLTVTGTERSDDGLLIHVTVPMTIGIGDGIPYFPRDLDDAMGTINYTLSKISDAQRELQKEKPDEDVFVLPPIAVGQLSEK